MTLQALQQPPLMTVQQLPMSLTVSEFDTNKVHEPGKPQPDTYDTIQLPRSYVAPPRIIQGFCYLDVDNNKNIRADSRVAHITRNSAVFHATSWSDTKLYRAVIKSLNICPANPHYLSGEHTRDRNASPTTYIRFQRPFMTTPKVVVFFNQIDLDRERDWNMFTTATDIDADGFTLNIETRGDTISHKARVGWFAYPEDREHIFSTSVSTRQIRPVGFPKVDHESKVISFSGIEFGGVPEVFIAFNEFNISCKANFRLKAHVGDVTKSGLTWHIETWGSTTLSSAGATIVAISEATPQVTSAVVAVSSSSSANARPSTDFSIHDGYKSRRGTNSRQHHNVLDAHTNQLAIDPADLDAEMPLYYLSIPGTMYIRNFCDRGDEPIYPHTRIDNSIRRIEVTLIPGQPTNLERLIAFTRHALVQSKCSKPTPFHYIAQIDWSLLRNRFYDINKLVDSLSCRYGLVYHLAFTNVSPGGDGFRSAELYLTSTGGTGGTRLKLPIHAFLDDGLVMYLSSSAGLPSPLTEISVEDTLPLDATTLSWASRNVLRLLGNRVGDIRRVTMPITIPHIHNAIPSLHRLYDLTFTHPKLTSDSPPLSPSRNTITSAYEQSIVASLSSRPCSPSSLSSSSRSSNISILTLPADAFASPAIRDAVARLSRLQEFKITFSSPLDVADFAHLCRYKPGDFAHLRCITFEGGTIPQFLSLLPSLFPSTPPLSPSLPVSTRASTSSRPTTPSRLQRPKFINLTLLISSLTASGSLKQLIGFIQFYLPHGVDIFKLHVKDWGISEPKSGSWWTEARVATHSGLVCERKGSTSHYVTADDASVLRVPGKVMCDMAHSCREEAGSRAKVGKKRWRHSWRSSTENGTLSMSSNSTATEVVWEEGNVKEKDKRTRREKVGSSLKLWVGKWWEKWLGSGKKLMKGGESG
ncbi:hypothetical protein NP233_g7571 [Leucocoprinus birnbaumii]|uniref:H-type lectin domain-containing protein n=1 Tax=Leucocoprinus birnbaumii TaxID=56174 RepID=A0AAD5YUL7_9AGAR|nr:hypothetical protein NP233_g7571 [Leucocoprinus birnbaumii]